MNLSNISQDYKADLSKPEKVKAKKPKCVPKAKPNIVKKVRYAIAQYNKVSTQELLLELGITIYSLDLALNHLVDNKEITREAVNRDKGGFYHVYYI
jgi:hypothetical protein